MKHPLISAALMLYGIALLGCSEQAAEQDARFGQEPGSTPTLAVASFGATGDAESGPYALRLMEITAAVATEFGARTDWQVMEGERVATLEEELDYAGEELAAPATQQEDSDNEYSELAGSTQTSIDTTPYARAFPTADFVLIGSINGFDVAPVRSSSQAALSARGNRIRSSIDFRVVDVNSRRWVASDTVDLDRTFADDSRAETQVNAFLQYAAQEVATRALRKLAGELVVERVEASGSEQRVQLSGGRAAGLQVGDQYRVSTGDLSSVATTVEIIEVFPEYAIAQNTGAALDTGVTFTPTPISDASTIRTASSKIRLGLMPCLMKDTVEFKANWAITVRNRLAIYLQGYDSVELVEDRAIFRNTVLGQQLLDDLSKGREVGLPLGSLRGVDYLAVCNLESAVVTAATSTTERVYDIAVAHSTEETVIARGSAHIIDVNSAASIAAVAVDTVVSIDAGDQERISAADRVAQKMFGSLMTALRPLAVAFVSGEQITLNHKAAIGVQTNDEFLVFERGQDLVDAMTGETLRNMGGAQVGRLRITGFDASGWIQARMIGDTVAEAGLLLRPVSGKEQEFTDSDEETTW